LASRGQITAQKADVTFASGAPADALAALAGAGRKRTYVDGGSLISSLLREDIVDEMVHPRVSPTLRVASSGGART